MDTDGKEDYGKPVIRVIRKGVLTIDTSAGEACREGRQESGKQKFES
jgi:hypothetical protein